MPHDVARASLYRGVINLWVEDELTHEYLSDIWNDSDVAFFIAGGIGLPRGRVRTLRQNVSRCDKLLVLAREPREGAYCFVMPLISPVPDRQQTDRIEKDGLHGWCSLCRAAISGSPPL